MKPIDAAIDAVALGHGVPRTDLTAGVAGTGAAYLRRLAAFVAYRYLHVSDSDIARGLGRTLEWVYDTTERLAAEVEVSRIVARDVGDAHRRAQALLDRAGVSCRAETPAVASPLDERQTIEALRLRAKGWSLAGLAKRYGVPPEKIAPVVGERWEARA